MYILHLHRWYLHHICCTNSWQLERVEGAIVRHTPVIFFEDRSEHYSWLVLPPLPLYQIPACHFTVYFSSVFCLQDRHLQDHKFPIAWCHRIRAKPHVNWLNCFVLKTTKVYIPLKMSRNSLSLSPQASPQAMRPRPYTATSFASNHSHKSSKSREDRKLELTESHNEKSRLHGKADPMKALHEAQPGKKIENDVEDSKLTRISGRSSGRRQHRQYTKRSP